LPRAAFDGFLAAPLFDCGCLLEAVF